MLSSEAKKVYVQHFNEKVEITEKFAVGNEEERYVYQIIRQDINYILKGFRIQLEQLNPENKETAKSFKKSLELISQVFQEFHYSKAACLLNPHIAAPLFLDFTIELPEDKVSCSYMHIQIIFEYAGIALNNLKPTGIELTYNLMRQSANALFLLHNLGIVHFDIKPANMVYDEKKDLLKIVDLGSAFGRSKQKSLTATTVNLADKVRSFTRGFAPPEILSMERNAANNPNLRFLLPSIDVYCWAMSFFALITNRGNADLKKYYETYKKGLQSDYKGFKEVVKISFNSVKAENDKEEDLKNIIQTLLKKVLRYKQKKRANFEKLISMMKEFEKEKKYKIEYSKIEEYYNKEISNLYMLNKSKEAKEEDKMGEQVKNKDEIKEDESIERESIRSTKKRSKRKIEAEKKEVTEEKIKEKAIIENKNAKTEDLELKKKILKDEKETIPGSSMVKLDCKHEVSKDYLIKYALQLFTTSKNYNYSCYCETCKKAQKLNSLPLSCGCIWTTFGKKIEYNNDLTKAIYGKCDIDHPLTSIDLGLVNDFLSSKLTSLMITDYPQEKEELVNSFSWSVGTQNLEDIAWILRHTKAVTKLNLSQKRIEDEGARTIGEALKINATLTELNLSKNNIGVEGGKLIGEALKINITLTELNLSRNNIGVEGGKIIGEALKTNTTLTKLYLSGDFFSCLPSKNIEVEGGKAIGEALKTNTTLAELDISRNDIGVEGGKVIGEALRTNTTLIKLYLSKNNIEVEGGKLIGQALRTNTTLTKLDLSRNNIGVEGGKLIGEALKTNTALKELDLSYNNIGLEGSKAIGEALKTNTALTELDLSSNKIGVQGVKLIGEALKTNTTLKELDLSSNNIEVEGGKVISEVLKTNTTLTELNLSRNKIGLEGVKLIGEALKTNTTLTKLNLSGDFLGGLSANNIGVEGVKVIGEVLKTNSTLTILSLGYNNIGDECMKTFNELLTINTTLKELNLANNEIRDKGIRVISEAIKVNTTLKKLHLWSNKLGPEGERLLKEVKENHKHIEIY